MHRRRVLEWNRIHYDETLDALTAPCLSPPDLLPPLRVVLGDGLDACGEVGHESGLEDGVADVGTRVVVVVELQGVGRQRHLEGLVAKA